MSSTYIKSPMNYVGNKYKALNSIIPLFPQEIDTFMDVFGGSGTVLFNTQATHYIYNDMNPYVASVIQGLVTADADTIVQKIEQIIEEYGLSKTNAEGFNKLRADYNSGKNDWITFFTLMCYSFNGQCRFNSKHEYNSSFGLNRSMFTSRQKNDIYEIAKRISGNVTVYSCSFSELNYSAFTKNDLLYFDPPYYNSVGSYNDGKRGFEGWTADHEQTLLALLDRLHAQGTRFALSNNLKYDNPFLNEWKDKYNVHYLNADYSNCNYHQKDKSKGIEVLITNY